MIADRELLTESAWLKRLVVREIQAAGPNSAGMVEGESGSRICIRRAARETGGCQKALYVRFPNEDWLLLEARAEARGLRAATYVSVLTRSHLRALTPLPREEYLVLKSSIRELAAIGGNINQIAKILNEGGRAPTSARDEFRAMLKICEALRDNTKAFLKANEISWRTGHAQADR